MFSARRTEHNKGRRVVLAVIVAVNVVLVLVVLAVALAVAVTVVVVVVVVVVDVVVVVVVVVLVVVVELGIKQIVVVLSWLLRGTQAKLRSTDALLPGDRATVRMFESGQEGRTDKN